VAASTCLRVRWYFRLANDLGERIGAARLPALQLDSARLMEIAREKTGLSDFGDDGFREGLEVFVNSLLHDADLSPIGRIGIRGMIVTLLSNRLRVAEARRREPSRFESTLNPPVVITGTPRSGTTFLHRLLAEDGSFRTLPLWRLFKPVSRDPEGAVRREVDRTLWLRRRLTPHLDRKHFVRSDSAEECIWLMNTSFTSHGLWVAAPVYGYLEWLGKQDRNLAYREYVELLRYFQSEQPDRCFLLKAPSHAGSLEALQDALPAVRIVQLHRDPVEVCSSLCSLFATLHSAVTRRLDLKRLGRTTLNLLLQESKRNLAARCKLVRPVLDIRYPDLLADPLATVKTIYGYLGSDWDRALEERIVRHLRDHPQGRHGRHLHDLATFGLSRQEIVRLFAPYRRALGL
jgi:hypothetical protein